MDAGALIVAGVAGGVAGVVGLLAQLLVRRAGLSAKSKLQQGIALGLAAGVAAGAAQYRPLTDWTNVLLGFKSKFEVVMVSEAQALRASPKFRALVEGKTAAEAHDLGAALSARGLQYLDASDVEVLARIKLVLAEASPEVCAGMWTGSLNGSAVTAALSTLSDDEMKAWARITTTASLRALDNDKPPAVDQEALGAGLEQILQLLPAADRQRASFDMSRQDLDDARACELMKLVLRESQKLPADARMRFLRALTQP
jgi:hypothetical protein